MIKNYKNLKNLVIKYAFVDVTNGREELQKFVLSGNKLPVKITGDIVDVVSHDDGTSIEFQLNIETLEILYTDLNNKMKDNLEEKDTSEEKNIATVKRNGNSIKYIENPSEKVQMEAVKQNPDSIQHIKEPTEKVQLVAVKRNSYSIEYIKSPSEKVQMEAVKEEGHSIKNIENPSEKSSTGSS